jgi:hypothetical protein
MKKSARSRKESRRRTLGSALVSEIVSAPKIDWEGEPALEITIVLTEELTPTNIPHGAGLNTLVQIHDALLERGDERFPHMRYATREDLAAEAEDVDDEF